MTNSPKGQLNPVLSVVVVIALASFIVVTAGSQYSLASITIVGGGGGAGMADLEVEEAIEAENATMAGATNQSTNGNMTEVQFLAIQNAQSGSISPINDTAYTLELSNVSDSTILFSERPERIVTSVSTSDFIGNWSAGPDSFAADAPNDALIVENTQTGELDTAIIEAFNPMYDANAHTLTYTIAAENATTIDLPYEFGQSILIVDSFPLP